MFRDLVVTRTVMLQSPALRVWEVLTDPMMTRQYMNECAVVSDWKIGSEVHWTDREDQVRYKGNVVDFEPERKIVYTYFDSWSDEDDHPSNYINVSCIVVPKNGVTELLITLTNFRGDDMRAEQAAANWDLEIIPKLKHLAEARTMAIMH